jgi:hypothetical protein
VLAATAVEDWGAVADGVVVLAFGRTGLNGLDFDVGLSLGGIVMLIDIPSDVGADGRSWGDATERVFDSG